MAHDVASIARLKIMINLFIVLLFYSFYSVEVYYFTRTKPTIVKMLIISDRGKNVSL